MGATGEDVKGNSLHILYGAQATEKDAGSRKSQSRILQRSNRWKKFSIGCYYHIEFNEEALICKRLTV